MFLAGVVLSTGTNIFTGVFGQVQPGGVSVSLVAASFLAVLAAGLLTFGASLSQQVDRALQAWPGDGDERRGIAKSLWGDVAGKYLGAVCAGVCLFAVSLCLTILRILG